MSKPALKPILKALRRQGDEAQVTQLLAGFASTDRRFASGLLKAFVSACRQPDAVARLGPIPDELDCEAEHAAVDAAGIDRGFVDLRFFNDDEGFLVFVELKVHSGYGHEQLWRYRTALEAALGRTALMAVTTWLPSYGEEEVAGDPRWLGSVRWAHAFDDLRALEHHDPDVTKLWTELLDLIREQGDFGVMDVDHEAIQGWARWKQGREQLTKLLEDVHVGLLPYLREALAQHAGQSASDDLATDILFKDKRLVWPWGESLNIQYAIPATNSERLRMQFVGGRDQLYFTVEARHGDNRVMSRATEALRAASDELRAKGFETGHLWGAYWSRPHAADAWANTSHVDEALMTLAKQDVDDLSKAGSLKRLSRFRSRRMV